MIKTNYFKFLMQLSFVTLITLGFNNTVKAQNVVPQDGKIEHNDSERPCIFVNLDPEPKPLKKAWKDFLKDNYDFKIKGIGFLSNKDLLYKEDVIIPKISSKRMNFYTEIVEDEVGSEMKVFASFGYDIYIDKNETPEEYRIMTRMLNEFLKSYLPDYYNDQVKDTEKKVKTLSKDVKGLNKDISKNNKKIENLTEEIEELTKESEEQSSALEIANTKLKERKEKLERINSKLK
ncbi:hypothetical protein ERX46_04170 [Brumimicrobium glaciale]|uniref:Uncharacterized protein n=1 Tax=Brumimicrobium glaciale TaxID=200475 RepID=A0A4Q4KN60_9FLAO|nr:hypothetical protein [Brumimicrobium glaciale]RYM34578.1 hypothetical protein ERX46_04170 [Brumimicrobium glaciale]